MCAESWATWLLFTGAPARCVALLVRCPGPLGFLFTGVPAPWVVLRVQCPVPLGSCSPVCPLGVLLCVCGVLGHLAPVHRCARSVRCVVCAVSSATWLLFTCAPPRCVASHVQRPGPLGSCSPVCPFRVLLCVINVCPWSRLDGAGHCSWTARKYCRPAHLHPKDLLDHLQRDHAADPAQRDQALAMLAGTMPGGQAGPFALAQARSRALTLFMGARPAGGQGASQSVAQRGAVGSAAQRGATTPTGSAEASTSGGEAAGGLAASAASKPAAATSSGDPRRQGPSRQPPAPAAGVPPPSNDPHLARGPGPQAKP